MRLLKKVRLYDSHSPFHQKEVNILVENGIIKAIGPGVQAPQAQIFEEEGACVSMGWIDIGGFTGEPGFEDCENLATFARAAASGGFTEAVCLPNTFPALDTSSTIAFIQSKSQHLPVTIYPSGALSKACEGKELAEMMELDEAGALYFTDGLNPTQDTGLLMRALFYAKSFDGIVANMPHDRSVAGKGMIHEGDISVTLGLKGIPDLAEALMVQRDISLVSYTQSRLLIHGISTSNSVEQIRNAKKKGIQVYASTPVLNLCFTDEVVAHFDENFKVLPPLRSLTDQKALWEGLNDGTIDFISSGHLPNTEEAKACEFPYAAFGTSTLENTFSAIMTYNPGGLALPRLIDKMTLIPRQILGLKTPIIAEGQPANLTVFHPSKSYLYERKHAQSLSFSSPFFDKKLNGMIFGTINGKKEWFRKQPSL